MIISPSWKEKGWTTPPKINIEPENDGLEHVFPFTGGVFSGSMSIFPGVHLKRPIFHSPVFLTSGKV